MITHSGYDIYYDWFDNHSAAVSPVLLLGGVLQNRKSWDSYIKDINGTCPVLVVDLPGIGDSKVLDATIGFPFLADCIKTMLAELQIPKVNIFSTSYSSIIAYEFSARYTQCVDKLIISSSMAILPNEQRRVMIDCIAALEAADLQTFYNVFMQGVSHVNHQVGNYELSRKVIGMLINALTDKDIARFIENTKRVLNYTIPPQSESVIPIEPLLFTGEFDTFTPPALCKEIGSYYQRSHFGVLKNCDHLFHIGNRRMIIETILPYFTEQRIPSFAQQDNLLALQVEL